MKSPGPTQETISALGRKRLAKFAALIPRIIVTEESETIHDARVSSRRMQQILKALAPQATKKNKHRKLLRALRNIRQLLGRPRNFDVMLKMVEEKVAGASNPVVRDAWDQLRTHLKERRARALERTREALNGFDVLDFAARCRAVIDAGADSQPVEEILKESIAAALGDWRDAITMAKAESGVDELHSLRIAGKRLRYRLELLADLGESAAKVRVKSLRALQDQLGSWHDSEVLLKTCAKFLTRKPFLSTYPGLARALLVEMERERRRADGAIEGLVKHAEKASQAFGDEVWASGNGQMAGAVTSP
jgi:CHAD domain-containing protein